MKKLIIPGLIALLALNHSPEITPSEKELLRVLIDQHPFSNRSINPEEWEVMPKEDRPDLAWEQNYLATMDPALGRPAPERLIPLYRQIAASQKNLAATPGSVSSPWEERGPSNVGGRTRALMYDPNDTTLKKVWAGGVTGGLWYNNDITNPQSRWIAVDDFWDNISISAIAYDPNNPQTFYVGTGEDWRQSVSGTRGAGIWKSTDGGLNWTQLPSTSNFYYVNDLVVRDENGTGVVYAGLRGNVHGQVLHGANNEGLMRSADGGLNFTQVLPDITAANYPYAVADIEIGANNDLWIGTIHISGTGSTKGGGKILHSKNGSSWTVVHSHPGGSRVELACAPSDSNYVYALIETSGTVGGFYKTVDYGTNWTNVTKPVDADNGIPASDFSRGQAWYDLILAVDPNDKNVVITGAVDLFKTNNGGTSWEQISKWSNNNNLSGLSCSYVHADQHAVVYKPGSSSEVIFGNDGGVFYTDNIALSPLNNVISERNTDYNVTQFYACAIHPTSGNDYFLAGSQDNGTQQFNGPGFTPSSTATGGDGAFCFIDQNNPNYQITAYVYNRFWLSTDGGQSFPSPRIQNDATGRFINPADYDDNQKVLFSARTNNSINRINDITGFPYDDAFIVPGMSGMASHLRVSPYTTASTTLFVGNDVGDLFKITNANAGTRTVTNIGSGLPAGYISCVEIGGNEDELLVTYSNYGLNSVWYTNNGGASWQNKEGNLPDMPVRWALFNPNDHNEVILATEVGVWSTTNLNSPSPTWASSNSGLANVRVDMLQLRNSDNEVIAATHGRGLFSSSGFTTSVPPVVNLKSNAGFACPQDTVALTDLSTFSPTTWQWAFVPNTVTFVNGTNSGSRHPKVLFNQSGSYQVILNAGNQYGSDSDTLQINAEIFPKPNITANQNVLTCMPPTGFTYQWYLNGTPISGATSSQYTSSQDGIYMVEMSGQSCTTPSNPYLLIHFDLEELASEIALELYPNPVSRQLHVSFENPDMEDCSLELISAQGRRVFVRQVERSRMVDEKLDLENLASGYYILKLKIGNEEYTRKINKL